MTLLFITQKLHAQDSFGVLWVNAFRKKGYEVTVLCLEGLPPQSGDSNNRSMFDFSVYSLGKEKGFSKLRQIFRFWKLISTLKYDRVFIHMAPVWGALGAWYWVPKNTPVYLWYTHYKMQIGVWLLGWYGKRFFCATPQSLPQFEGNPKKIVTGHGIDMQFWPKRENHATNGRALLMVHRLSRSKRLELSLRALVLLPDTYTLDIYGIEAEKGYVKELKALVSKLELGARVIFHGTIPMSRLPEIYMSHRLILNMASETIDKTMLEAMTCGCYPVTTYANAAAIGITDSPIEDTEQAIASFVEMHTEEIPMSLDDMYKVVVEKHSLDGLITKMDRYIRDGI